MLDNRIAILKQVIMHPTVAFKEINENGDHYFVTSVIILVISSFSTVDFISQSNNNVIIPTNEIGYVLDAKLQVISFGHNILLSFLSVVILFFIGKKLGGSSNFKNIFSVVSYSFIPSIIGDAIIHVFIFAPFLLETLSGINSNDRGFEGLNYLIYFGFLPFAVWSFILTIKAIKLANSFGTGKAIGILLLSGLITGLMLLPLLLYQTDNLPSLYQMQEQIGKIDSHDWLMVGFLPSDIAVNQNTNMIYVSHGTNTFNLTKGIDVINGTTHKVVGNIMVPDAVEGIIVDPDTNMIYVAINHHKVPDNPHMEFDSIYGIDGKTNNITKILKSGGSLTDISLNPNTNTIYAINFYWNSFMAIDLARDEPLAHLSEFRSPRDIAINSQTNMIYVTDGGSKSHLDVFSIAPLYVIDGKTNTIVTKIDIGKNPTNIAVNPNTNKIYVTSFGTLSNGSRYDANLVVVDGFTNTVIEKMDIVRYSDIAVNTKTNRVYITNTLENTVSILDGNTNDMIATIPVGKGPQGIAVNENTNLIYVVNHGSSTISAINGTTNELIRFH